MPIYVAEFAAVVVDFVGPFQSRLPREFFALNGFYNGRGLYLVFRNN